jgi:hypothetical protein
MVRSIAAGRATGRIDLLDLVRDRIPQESVLFHAQTGASLKRLLREPRGLLASLPRFRDIKFKIYPLIHVWAVRLAGFAEVGDFLRAMALSARPCEGGLMAEGTMIWSERPPE